MRKKFTTIEMLVVIALIALMAALVPLAARGGPQFVANLTNILSRLQAYTNSNDTALSAVVSNLGSVSNDVDTAEATLASAVSNLGSVSNDVDTAEATLASSVSSLASVSNDVDTAEATLASAVSSLASVSNDVDTVEAILASGLDGSNYFLSATAVTGVVQRVDGVVTNIDLDVSQ